MKKLFLLLVLALVLCSCAKKAEELPETVVKPDFEQKELEETFGTEETFIVKTYMETPAEEYEQYLDENLIITNVRHYQLSDGSWKTDDNNYKYKLKITGSLNNAEKDSTYVILSNNPDISFDMAWKASGLSSYSEDYFKPEDAIFLDTLRTL